MKRLRFCLACLSVSFAASAQADRMPTPMEKTDIEKALRAQGFVDWEEISLDTDGPYWDIDDARKKDGQRWDVRLAPSSYDVIRVVRDD